MTRAALSKDALAALDRRGFLKSAGVLSRWFFWFFHIGKRRARPVPPAVPQFPVPLRTPKLDSWIAIAPDGAVTAYSGKEELGQGIADQVRNNS